MHWRVGGDSPGKGLVVFAWQVENTFKQQHRFCSPQPPHKHEVKSVRWGCWQVGYADSCNIPHPSPSPRSGGPHRLSGGGTKLWVETTRQNYVGSILFFSHINKINNPFEVYWAFHDHKMRFKMINPKVSDIAHLRKMQGSEIITVPGFSQEWWSSPLCSHALPSEYFPPPNKIIAENFHFYILKIIQQLHLKVHWILDWSWYWMRCHLVGEGKSHGKERPMSIARFSQPRVVISFQICFKTRTTNSELQK